jgi:hypothetical protein
MAVRDEALATEFRRHELAWLIYAFGRPAPLFRRSLEAVLRHARLPAGTLVDICVRRSREARISSTRRVASRYEITVRRGMFYLLLEAAELVHSRLRRLSNSGKVRYGAEWSEERLRELVKHDVTRYLGSGRWSGRMGVLRDLLARRLRDSLEPADRWKPTSMLLRPMVHFIVAHEVAHVAAGHCDRVWEEGAAGRLAAEMEADSVATEWWMAVINEESMGDPPPTQWIVCQFALTAVAILFGMLQLMDDAALKLRREMTRNHPPANERYAQFRQRCLALGVNQEHFHPQRQVERIHEDFGRLAATIEWN